jgi:hypothetical protein
MTELKMTTEAEVEDFTDELSDEALDRAEGGACGTGLVAALSRRGGGGGAGRASVESDFGVSRLGTMPKCRQQTSREAVC